MVTLKLSWLPSELPLHWNEWRSSPFSGPLLWALLWLTSATAALNSEKGTVPSITSDHIRQSLTTRNYNEILISSHLYTTGCLALPSKAASGAGCCQTSGIAGLQVSFSPAVPMFPCFKILKHLSSPVQIWEVWGRWCTCRDILVGGGRALLRLHQGVSFSVDLPSAFSCKLMQAGQYQGITGKKCPHQCLNVGCRWLIQSVMSINSRNGGQHRPLTDKARPQPPQRAFPLSYTETHPSRVGLPASEQHFPVFSDCN